MAATAPTVDETPSATRRMAPPRALLAMARPIQIVLIVVIFANGALLAAWHQPSLPAASLVSLLTSLVLLIVAAASVHLANEAADHETDRLTQRTPFSGGSGALLASGLDPGVPLRISLVLAGLVILATPATIAIEALPMVTGTLLLIGLIGGLAYSLPPVAAERRGWGEPLNAILGALALPLFGVAAAAGSVGLLQAVAFLPFLCVTFVSVMTTAWPDRRADASTGKLTLQVRLPPPQLRRIALLSVLGFLAATFLSIIMDAMPAAIAGLLVTPLLAVGLVRYTRSESPVANVAAMVGLGVITAATLIASLVARTGVTA